MKVGTALTRLQAAEAAFEQFEWPESVTVEAVNGWDDSGEAMRRDVFVRLPEDAYDAPTRRVEFIVSFDNSELVTGHQLRGLDLP